MRVLVALLAHADMSDPFFSRIRPPLRSEDYDVWFGTNRQPLSSRNGFSAERDSVVHLGRCCVSIPSSHKIGSLGSPWWKRILGGDDRLRVVGTEEIDELFYWRLLA